ncbi:hypothetical protein [Microbacterium sp. W4I20]|uniref:hypothetical protein n=1 Tax=Microbacterium sp. W4I20 TaxID=3042262 RepID=UPI0027839255|nr:hypothetical protein [Microbacterium sp. W4I20]MDQ0727695.1 MFS family permease [Microbacterium sp. W4I20]
MAPLILWVTIVVYPLTGAVEVTVDFADDSTGGLAVLLAGAVVVVLVFAVVATWGIYRVMRAILRRLTVGIGTMLSLALIVACLAGLVVDGYNNNAQATVSPVFSALLILVLCILVTGMGGGALISWASRLAVRNASAIGHMASIALPVILMLVVFAFFSAEVWQMASASSWGSIALVGLVVAVLAGIVVLRVSASEIDDDAQAPTEVQRRALLVDTPAEHRSAVAAEHRPLGRPQRWNILLAMTIAQLVQALFFALLLAALLIVIGGIAIPEGVVGLWLGPGSEDQPLAVEHLMIGEATLPVTVNLLKAATLLAMIATLPFVFSAVSEARYRERFFDPIMADMRRAMLVRDALSQPAPR